MRWYRNIRSSWSRYRLSRRLLFFVVVCSSFFTLLATSIQLYIDFKNDISLIDDNLRFIEDSYVESIAGSVYQTDKEQLRTQLRGALKLQDVQYLEVKEQYGDEVFKISEGNYQAPRDIVRIFPLVFQRSAQESIECGTLTAVASLDGVYKRLWRKAVTILATNAIKTFIASFFILLIIYRLSTRHLLSIAQWAEKIDWDSFGKPLKLGRKEHAVEDLDELDRILIAIDGMRGRLRNGMEERERARQQIYLQNIELKKQAQTLEEKERWLRTLMEQLPLPMMLSTAENIEYLNANHAVMFGYTQEDCSRVEESRKLFFPDNNYRAKIMIETADKHDAIERGEIVSFGPWKTTCRNGKVKDVEQKITKLGDKYLSIYNDVTDRLRMQEIMIQTEKMMSVGGLAAGMAHEINNPLGAIVQGVQVINLRLKPDHPKNQEIADRLGIDLRKTNEYLEQRKVLKMLEIVLSSVNRASKIVTNMLAFGRKSDVGKTRIDVRIVLEKALEFAQNDFDLKKKYDFKNVRIEKNYADDLNEVECAETEIQQVVLNLLKNAAQALFEINGDHFKPVIRIDTREVGGEALIEISDNGPGMSIETQRRVFEPFFTTKAVGVGTGLGLSVAYFIITNNHDGAMEVRSDIGKGTTFTIKLPLPAQ